MGIFSRLFRSRDKPKNSYDSPSYTYFFGRTHAGKRVNDRTALQQIAVYACVRVLSEAIAQLPLHLYKYTDKGKERVPEHPLYFLLHDQPNPEMTSFIFRETLMSHLLIYGNAFAQIIRNGRGGGNWTCLNSNRKSYQHGRNDSDDYPQNCKRYQSCKNGNVSHESYFPDESCIPRDCGCYRTGGSICIFLEHK